MQVRRERMLRHFNDSTIRRTAGSKPKTRALKCSRKRSASLPRRRLSVKTSAIRWKWRASRTPRCEEHSQWLVE